MKSSQYLRTSLLITASLLSAQAAQAALYDRGGGLIYDDVLDITWLQDMLYARSSGSLVNPDSAGRMTWADSVTWADNLSYYDSVRGVTYDDWRLPKMIDTGTPGCNYSYSGTDCGYNVQTRDSGTGVVYSTPEPSGPGRKIAWFSLN